MYLNITRIKRAFLLIASLLFISLSLSFLSPTSVKADIVIIRVPSDYRSIQNAIDAAAPDSMILVSNGIYYEHLMVNKTLLLIGEGREVTIIDGNGTETAITIMANHVTINGFTIRNGSMHGIHLKEAHNNTITNNNVMQNEVYGIRLENSSYNNLTDNIIVRNGQSGHPLSEGYAIALESSNTNIIRGNTITNHPIWSLFLNHATNNTVVENTMINNTFGLVLSDSSNNTIHHNNFINNDDQALQWDSDNIWDNGTAGNYWDNYVGIDDGSGSRVMGDGVGDTSLPHLGFDFYPLITPWNPISIIWENTGYPVALFSNSTVSTFRFVQTEKKVTFNVRGPPDTAGYCNVTIPKNLLRDNPWKIMLNTTDIVSQAIITENQTHTTIHFTYSHLNNYNIRIIGTWVIPEHPSATLLTLLMTLTITLLISAKKIAETN